MAEVKVISKKKKKLIVTFIIMLILVFLFNRAMSLDGIQYMEKQSYGSSNKPDRCYWNAIISYIC